MPIGDIDYREYFLQDTIDQLEKAFQYYDATGDGAIDTSELFNMFRQLGKPVTKHQLRDLVSEVDVDDNGEIDFEEYCLLEIKMTRARPRADLIKYREYLTEATIKQLDRWFTLNDMGDDGLITVDAIMRIVEQQAFSTASPEFCEDVLSEVDPQGTGSLDFDRFCAFWAIITRARKLVNYREFLTGDEVNAYREQFNQASLTRPGVINRQELDSILRNLGITIKARMLNSIFHDFDHDRSGSLDFEELCVMMLRLRAVRKIRTISPETCSCHDLWHLEGFTVLELQRSGFGLQDFAKIGVPVRQLYRTGEFTALELRKAGYSAGDLRRGGVGLIELRSCGYSLAELRLAGFSAAALAEANRSLQGSISSGNLMILPQICPRPVRSSWSKHARKSASFEVLKNGDVEQIASLPPKGWVVPEMRQMTPVIREHTDWDRRPTSSRRENRFKTFRNVSRPALDGGGFILDACGLMRQPNRKQSLYAEPMFPDPSARPSQAAAWL
eukprot:TRINITY_DN23901_c0_g1_i1.p1 TRINITY_DN23901_c0_g1~~TRINITY_DN23901_c0_g1_i1.p1  ORF type:complete len:501 (+),score=69.12 TRINITY_DN23901_c0_g1_i1:80-1582(+)